jgi:hypothetical protein
MATNKPARVFTAFDYDHDEGLRNLLVGQPKHTIGLSKIHSGATGRTKFARESEASIK